MPYKLFSALTVDWPASSAVNESIREDPGERQAGKAVRCSKWQ